MSKVALEVSSYFGTEILSVVDDGAYFDLSDPLLNLKPLTKDRLRAVMDLHRSFLNSAVDYRVKRSANIEETEEFWSLLEDAVSLVKEDLRSTNFEIVTVREPHPNPFK